MYCFVVISLSSILSGSKRTWGVTLKVRPCVFQCLIIGLSFPVIPWTKPFNFSCWSPHRHLTWQENFWLKHDVGRFVLGVDFNQLPSFCSPDDAVFVISSNMVSGVGWWCQHKSLLRRSYACISIGRDISYGVAAVLVSLVGGYLYHTATTLKFFKTLKLGVRAKPYHYQVK